MYYKRTNIIRNKGNKFFFLRALGKTSLIHSYKDDLFPQVYVPTL